MTRLWRWLARTWRQRFTHDMTFRDQPCPCCTQHAWPWPLDPYPDHPNTEGSDS